MISLITAFWLIMMINIRISSDRVLTQVQVQVRRLGPGPVPLGVELILQLHGEEDDLRS